MKHDKLFLVRILCLIGIAGELLIPNNIIRMLFGLFFAIISVAFLLMHKNDIILEESDRKIREARENTKRKKTVEKLLEK